MGTQKLTDADCDKYQALVDAKRETIASCARFAGVATKTMSIRLKARREELKRDKDMQYEKEMKIRHDVPIPKATYTPPPKPTPQFIRIPVEYKAYIKRALITALSAYKKYKNSESSQDYLDTWEKIKNQFF